MFRSSLHTQDGKPIARASSAPYKPYLRLNAADPINNNLYARWIMSEGSGPSLYDLSSNRKPLALVGPTWTTNDNGPAVSFNGTSNYANGVLTNGPSIVGSAHTIFMRCAITNLSATNRYLSVWGSNGAAILYGYVSNSVEFYANAGTYTGTDPRASTAITWPSNNLMHTIAYTYSAGTQKGYLDGGLVINLSKTFTLTNTSTSFFLAAADAFGAYAPVVMDTVAIWSRALSETEISMLNSNPCQGVEASG